MEDIKILSPGKRLKEIRKILNVKQDELAGEKFCKNYISMFENNKRKINVMNAVYLARKINEVAEEKEIDLEVSSIYFLKNEMDVARDKCKKWIEEVENGEKDTDETININLYKVIIIATKYELVEYLARALYLKGMNSMNNNRYNCARTQFLTSIMYYSKLDRMDEIAEIYMNMGNTYYNQKLFNEAIAILNLGASICSNDRIIDEIKSQKGLCYFALGEHEQANRIISEVENK